MCSMNLIKKNEKNKVQPKKYKASELFLPENNTKKNHTNRLNFFVNS